ncbi:methylmalonyl Co-A mutase-associated GTPase MeaB [Candidatus Mycolicibacterium alkanivorans]|uniref:Methylmalonyl Co-A mutase-associated GTPase MeaB n=1 Tax=Candidatus Mycolicibacterium alkanivorans TaxID=2954114 RepID=A0ABS9YX75_9MYCO|nr:methylmalonyl Co-A mutase-associated GTPase MeaB [Candidatus Mycolicibacterium alkanivorans]MCI4675815.1 methylmalonyl Co-A mutase-associated GTPase MeaB [Candidatus Mycolicibacterium alkanivorans]
MSQVATPSPVVAMADRIRAGSQVSLARGLTLVESRAEAASELLAEIWKDSGQAHVVGITGPAGSGKSTLVTAMAREYVARGSRVAILAVDPSSAYSGGAILGDRIRMTEHAGNKDIFIRSMASRGATGGLSRAVLDGIVLLDAAGFDVVILETVGVGQAEVDVISVAHTVLVVSVPGLGDDIQAIKAGLIEIADIHVVNKADRPGADLTVKQLRESLRLAHGLAGKWDVPILKTTASDGDGVPELLDKTAEHRHWMTDNGAMRDVERRNAATRIRWAAETLIAATLRSGHREFDAAVDALIARTDEPRQAAARLLTAMAVDPTDINGKGQS